MRITKYPQSCLLVETGSARLLVDPGTFVTSSYEVDTFGDVDAVLYTHRHADHFDETLLDPLAEAGARFVSNADVASLIPRHEVTVLGDQDTVTLAGVGIQAYDIPHFVMVDGSPGPPNLGFVIDQVLLHPGDGVSVPAEVDIVAAPIAGPSISMHDAYRLVKGSRASHVIPIHYDGFLANPEQFAEKCPLGTMHVLGNGESVDLTSA